MVKDIPMLEMCKKEGFSHWDKDWNAIDGDAEHDITCVKCSIDIETFMLHEELEWEKDLGSRGKRVENKIVDSVL